MSSISTTSTIVSFRDDDMELEEALDLLYSDIQKQLNYSQCAVRQLAMSSEQDDDYLEAAKIHFEIEDYVDMLLSLFKELKGVAKQCLGSCPKQLKEEYKQMCEKRKEDKKREKEQAKLQSIQE
jgi:hypothetical protein